MIFLISQMLLVYVDDENKYDNDNFLLPFVSVVQ